MATMGVLELVSVASIVIAIAAVFTAYIAPINAAKIAAKLSLEQVEKFRQEELRRSIFIELINIRRRPMTDMSAAALNLIDFVLIEDKKVRNSWSRLHDIYNSGAAWDQQQRALNELIGEIAISIGISDDFGHADVARSYVPGGLADIYEAASIENRLRLVDLKAELARRSSSDSSQS